jgi:hypothetical protein
MSELMNTVRATKRLMPASARLPVDIDGRTLLALVALCATLFIAFFAVARALSPSGHAASGSLPSVIAAPTGDQVPLRLTAAPAMQAGARVAPKPVVRRVPVRRASAASQAPVTSTTAAPVTTSAAPVVSAPPSATPVATPEPAPAPAKAPQPQRSPPPKPSGGGGTSFDSSG